MKHRGIAAAPSETKARIASISPLEHACGRRPSSRSDELAVALALVETPAPADAMDRPVRPTVLGRLGQFFANGAFAAFALLVLFFFELFLITIIFIPPTGSAAWKDFVDEFLIRCFSYDPKSGWMNWSLAWTMIVEPLFLQSIIAFIWRRSILDLWRNHRRVFLHTTAAALAVAGGIAASFVGFGKPEAKPAALPFPAGRIRTAFAMPQFTLTDHTGNAVSIADYKGRVVLLTAVYSSCATTCPLILMQMRKALAQLSPAEHKEVAVIAISLNPAVDTRALRAATVEMYCGGKPWDVRFVSGEPADVNALLDKLQVTRTVNPQTGQIEHANLFFILDREGRIAYRLSLSQQHEPWLLAAIRDLISDEQRTWPSIDGRRE